MKERPIFESKEPNKELVTLSDEDKKGHSQRDDNAFGQKTD